MTIDAEELQGLLDRVSAGEKLTTEERREALGKLRTTRPDAGNTELAQLLGVSPRSIFKDLESLAPDTEAVQDENDPAVQIDRLKQSCTEQKARLEKSLAALNPKSKEYQACCSRIVEIDLKTALAIAKLEKNIFIPQQEYHYVCVIPDTSTGVVSCLPFKLLKPEEQAYHLALDVWMAAKATYEKWQAEEQARRHGPKQNPNPEA